MSDVQTARCEDCFTVLPLIDLCKDGADQICVVCLDKREKSKAVPFYKHATAYRAATTHGRCEKCMNLFALVTMKMKGNQHLCETCYKEGREWYALALVGSETKVTKTIRREAKRFKVDHLIGKITAPKARDARVTKPSWEVIDSHGAVVGRVSAEDYEEALRTAKTNFEPKSQKGVFKPTRDDVIQKPLAELTKAKEKTKVDGKWVTRVVYTALAADKTVLGKIGNVKSEKQAREIAEKLYGAKDKPKTAPIVQVQVEDVRQVKEGGEIRINNRRSMKGYLIVEVVPNNDVMSVLKTCPGVYSVLPFSETPTPEQVEKGNVVAPTGLSIKEIEKHTKTPKQALPAMSVYKPGQKVAIVAGLYKDQETVIEKQLDGENYAVNVSLLGTKTRVTVHCSALRSAN